MRGLDYYRHTAFEFVTDRLGAQGTVLAGGRYDGLVGNLGGPETPGVGWAAGVERLAMLIPEPAAERMQVAVVGRGLRVSKGLRSACSPDSATRVSAPSCSRPAVPRSAMTARCKAEPAMTLSCPGARRRVVLISQRVIRADAVDLGCRGRDLVAAR